MTNLDVYVGPPVEPTEREPRHRRRTVRVALGTVVTLLGVVAVTAVAAPGLLGPWTTRGAGGVPASITTPWAWQASVQNSPPGPASLIFTGDGADLLEANGPGRIAVVGRSGAYRNVYPHEGRWTAGGNAHLSPDGRYVASMRLHGTDSGVSVTDLSTGEVRNLPGWQGREVIAVYGWRPDSRAMAIGFRAGSPLALGVLELDTGRTTPAGVVAAIPELAGDVTVAFSPDGQWLAVAIGSVMAVYDSSPTLVDPDDYAPLWTTPLETGQIFSGAFTPDGRRIVLFDAPECAPPTCPAQLTWHVSYLDATSGAVANGPVFRPFEAAAVRAVGWNETTGGLVVVGLTREQPTGPTDRDARQLIQPGQADLYELRPGTELHRLVDAPDDVTGLDVAADLVRAGRFGDQASVPSVFPFERAPFDLGEASVVGAILAAIGAVVFVRRWQGRRPRKGRHRAPAG